MNKSLLINAGINLILIVGCRYVQTEKIGMCERYPLQMICAQDGTVNGAWIFVAASLLFSY